MKNKYLTETEAIIFFNLLETKEFTTFFSINPPYYFTEAGRKVYDAINKAFFANMQIDINLLIETINPELIEEILRANRVSDLASSYRRLTHEYKMRKQLEFSERLRIASRGGYNILTEIRDDIESCDYSPQNYINWDDYIQGLKTRKLNDKKYNLNVNFLDIAFGGGLNTGHLVLVSGDPETGKTCLVVQILENLARTTKVCLFPLEFPLDTILPKRENIVKEIYSPDDFEKIIKNMYFVEQYTDIEDIKLHIVNMANRGVKFFAIDSQMRIESLRGVNMEERESRKFAILSQLAYKFSITIFLIVQIPKDGVGIMGTKKGEHEASIIINIVNSDKNPLEKIIIFKKNKLTGNRPKTIATFNPRTLYFHSDAIKPYNEYMREGD